MTAYERLTNLEAAVWGLAGVVMLHLLVELAMAAR